LFQARIDLLQAFNRTEESIACAREAAHRFPGDFFFPLKEALTLPVVYDTPEQIAQYRHRFVHGLGRLAEELRLDTPQARRNALDAIGRHTNVLLAYQAQNDCELQMRYGEIVHRIMDANYPRWTRPLPMPPLDGPLRIGYVSSRFRDLSATKYFLGWLRGHDSRQFALHTYYVGDKTDSVTEQIRQLSRRFQHLPDAGEVSQLERACQAILDDQLHILVFLDIGLNPVMTQLAALRLAPVQCMSWDHPVTSGLRTVDYYLSSALTEPPDAPSHYTETLVPLPGVAVCYPKPVIPGILLNKTRRDFQLPEDALVYLCCQSALKWLPDQDAVFPQIARQVPRAVFVFLMMNPSVSADFQKRLERAFSQAGLRAADHCVLLPEVEPFTYWNLNLLGDVFLDSIGWSGGVSTFEAVACRVPVVTLPGQLMRGRQSCAILTQLGVTDTIARDLPGYIAIAVRLGLDRAWREEIVQRMIDGYPDLFSDRHSVPALEEFFLRVAGKLSGQGPLVLQNDLAHPG
jgi:protein O-GlcNAc transferase